jgi:hypothetical protein
MKTAEHKKFNMYGSLPLCSITLRGVSALASNANLFEQKGPDSHFIDNFR